MKRASYIALLCLLSVAALVGCGEDRTHEYYEMTEENQWTYSKMKEVYLWKDEIKEPKYSDFFTTTTKFFNLLKYSGDKVSYFTDTVSAGSYGVTFAVMRDPIGKRPSKVYALALLVEPGSPADIAGIERGTWISSVDGKAFTLSKYSMLQSGGNAEVATEYIEFDDDTQEYYWEMGDTLQMPTSTDFPERAIYLDSIYTVRSKNIGYLVLNNFNGDDFVQQTQDVMMRFAADNVDNVVIDLRYCTGGSIANATSLASTFVPVELYGTPFGRLVDIEGNVDTTYCYTQQQTTLGECKLFVITGNSTGGAAELFTAALNSSLPMYDLITIGAMTAGKNVMTENFVSPYGFAINPATNLVAMADSTLLPDTGIEPDYPLNELSEPERIYPLGSEQEYMLFNVMHLVNSGMLPGEASSVTVPAVPKAGKAFLE